MKNFILATIYTLIFSINSHSARFKYVKNGQVQNRIYQVEIDEKDTVGELKERLAQAYPALGENLRLIVGHNGTLFTLEDTWKTLESYGLTNKEIPLAALHILPPKK